MEAKERFKQLMDELIQDGKLYPCPDCGKIRDSGLCLSCEEANVEKTYCVVCEDNDNPANTTSSKCKDYCQEVHERNPEY